MDLISQLSALLGVSFTSGINLYLTLCMVGLAHKLGWAGELRAFEALDNWFIIIVCGVMFLVEFVIDKLPAVDHVWNVIHTVIRPAAAAAVAVAVADHAGMGAPGWILAGLGAAGVALTTHTAKSGTRVAIAPSPEPFSDIILSLAEDGLVAVLVVLIVTHPIIAGIVCLVLLAVLAVVMPKLWRGMMFTIRGFCGWVAGLVSPRDGSRPLADMESADADALARLGLADRRPELAVRAAVKGLKGAGWLRRGRMLMVGDDLVFAYRKWFRTRAARLPLADIPHAQMKRGLLASQLWVQTGRGAVTFLITRRADRLADRALELLGGETTPTQASPEDTDPAAPPTEA